MLKYRILTALVLIPLVLLGIFYLPPLIFAAVSAGILLLAGWEWAKLTHIQARWKRIGYLLCLLIFFILLSLLPALIVFTLACITWGILLYFVCHYAQFKALWSNTAYWQKPLGGWLLGTCWYALNFLQQENPMYVLFLLLFIWGADIGAYFVGKRFGRHKLAPEISPGKSLEGLIGGTLTSLLIGLIGGWFLYGHFNAQYVCLQGIAFVISLVSVLGDLSESMIKRLAAVKDSGGLLPGHGGVLDRLDSLLSAAPVFVMMLFFCA